jgi:hypothetical protein
VAITKIDFSWARAFAKSPGNPAYECADGKIRQVARGKQQYAPFAHGDLFLEFSQLDGSEKACVGFAEKWGLLTQRAFSTGDLPSEDLSFWRAEIRKMHIYVQMLPKVIRVANSRGTFAKVGKVDVLLVPGIGPKATPVLVMEPADLLQAMNLEMAQFVAGGGVPANCEECGRLFGAGGAGKRTDAKFCSDGCRNRFHYSKKRKRRVSK